MIPAPRPHDPLAADWITALFLVCLVVLTIINHAAPRTWRILLHAAFRMRLGRQTLREDVESFGRKARVSFGTAYWCNPCDSFS